MLGEKGAGRRWLAEVLTCPYTWIGWGCKAALRRVLSGFLAAGLAPQASPCVPSRSSCGSPCTTKKPRSWGKGARPPCNLCVQPPPRAPGGSRATRVNRKGSLDSLLLLRVAMFGRTLPQVAPPPGENVQRAPGQRGAGAGAARAAPGAPSRPGRSTAPATAATATAAARSRSLCAAPSRVCSQRVPFAHFLRSPRLRPRPLGWGSQGRERPPEGTVVPARTPRPPCRSEELRGRRALFLWVELATPRAPGVPWSP